MTIERRTHGRDPADGEGASGAIQHLLRWIRIWWRGEPACRSHIHEARRREEEAEPIFIVSTWTAEDARRQALAFIAHPTAFWLDPNLWGDNPNWRDGLYDDQEVMGEWTAPIGDDGEPMVPTADGGWRPKLTPAEVRARNRKRQKKKDLAKRDDYYINR